ncbi:MULTISPECIES: tRNA (guanosine(37)-N1)-methyltransferase TrmD [unclassified Siphonobacter]|uniref:tRNA (guanosine(37)-N1)-methyltransferase TrmD n=1 Tax=unclassified Siphonobacter TaxID=2635712 RepID=UPI000CA9C21D|nr:MULTISPECIES: tRNA (guanosine(37)-N1)-methyltransferase TrmD [unclassified Siphonobacter]PKK35559.1 tRNA (guanosine(37)-N1)-methyltransferase TrmD [Siphonobacter sp. SORGH_AS_0500]
MRLDIISAVPELLDSFFQNSIVKRAQEKGHVEVHIHNLHDYGIGKYKQIDDYPFGGGAGMVLMIDPIAQLIRKLQSERTYDEVIYTAPDGERFNQRTANTLSMTENLIIICGHYKGIDERLREIFVTKEISIGDYVLSGGELAASVISDAIIRLLPGVLGDETSALTDSFQDNLLAPPVYTRPSEWEGHKVPDVLLSGHDAKIQDWRHEQAVERTQQRRPDLLA